MFKCDICENTFTRERNMRRHKKNVHEKSTGVCCNKCNKTFTRADNMKAHQKVCGKYLFSEHFDLEIKYFSYSCYRRNSNEKIES